MLPKKDNTFRARNRKILCLLLLTWGSYFTWLLVRMMTVRPDGIYLGHENLWSDWALHISLATIFAEKPRALWFAYHPLFADGKLTYAFLTNLISGLLLRLDLTLPEAFILPSILLFYSLLAGMHRFLTVLIGSGRKAAIAVSVFLLSSGLGFVDYFRDCVRAGTFFVPLRQYSALPNYGWGTGNFVVGHLLPQRAFLLGMTLGVWALSGLFAVILNADRDSRRDRSRLVWSGIATGLLPIAHMHTLIALIVVGGPLLLWSFWRGTGPSRRLLLYYVVPAGGLAAILFFLFVYGGIANPHFMSWHPFYTAAGLGDWLAFWLRAWGLMLPIAVLTLILNRKLDVPRRIFYAGAFGLFGLGNLIYFQPISWDNSKLFLWCYFVFSALATEGLFQLYARRNYFKVAAILGFAVLTMTGALELILLQQVDRHTFQLLNGEELELADEVRHNTDFGARFLTAPDHNTWVMVRGARPILMGYPAWVMNFGFLYGDVERDARLIYAGGPDARALLRRHAVSYVVIGPSEVRNFHPNLGFFKQNFPVRFKSDRVLVFDVRGVLGQAIPPGFR